MKLRDIFESPLASYDLHGDWSDREENLGPKTSGEIDSLSNAKNSFINKRDRVLATKPETKQRLGKLLVNGADYKFAIHIINDPRMLVFLDVLDYGRIDGSATGADMLKQMEASGGPARTIWNIITARKKDEITFILAHNEGGEVRHPLTPWIIMHRCAHALPYTGVHFERDFSTPIYNYIKKQFPGDDTWLASEVAQEIIWSLYTFKSGRERKMNDSEEEAMEVLTQYMVKGDLPFNKPITELVAKSIVNQPKWVDPNPEETQRLIEYRRQYVMGSMDDILRAAVGGVFVC